MEDKNSPPITLRGSLKPDTSSRCEPGHAKTGRRKIRMEFYYQDGRRVEVSETRDRLNEIEQEQQEARHNGYL